MVVASMEAVENGSFGGEVLYGTLQNGTLSAGRLSDLVPADVQEKYLGYIDEMIKDTFMTYVLAGGQVSIPFMRRTTPHAVGCNQRKQPARRESFWEDRSWRKGGCGV